MKKFLIIIFLFACFQLDAQNYRVVEKGGEKYYVHSVEAGNTLYAISKIYGVDVAYIEEANENVRDGLSVGEEVLIPIKFRDRKFNKKPKPVLNENFIVHTVFKKETIYSIAKNYNISENDLLDANPSANNGLKRGQKLVIPLADIRPAKLEHMQIAEESRFLQHKVEKGQTLYAISKEYNVEIDDILRVNPGLTQTLSTGMLLNLPIEKKEEITDIAVEEKDSLHVDFDKIQVKNIALLLPFEFKDLDSLTSTSSRRNAFAMIDLAIEFYRGAKIACEEYSRQGGNVNLMVFNMKNEPGMVDKCIREGWLDECDVIIGPFHKKTFTELSNRLKGKEKILVSPNLKTTSILKNQDVFKVNPDRGNEVDFIAKFVAEKHFSENIIIVDSEIKRDLSLVKAMEMRLNLHLGKQEERLFDKIKKVSADEEGPKEERVLSMTKDFFKDTSNVVIVPSNNLSFVSDVLTKLNRSELSDKKIQVYGFESWSNFDNIDINYKQKFNLMLCATKTLDYENPEVRKFMRKYFRIYETVPSEKGYAFLSFDIANFLLLSMDTFGNKAYRNLDKVEGKSIYQNISVERTDNGSWTNKGFFFLNHRDFKLLKTEK